VLFGFSRGVWGSRAKKKTAQEQAQETGTGRIEKLDERERRRESVLWQIETLPASTSAAAEARTFHG